MARDPHDVDWQPIKTAPVMASPQYDRANYFLCWNGNHIGVCLRVSKDESDRLGAGTDVFSEFGEPVEDATHWMPLPNPPKS